MNANARDFDPRGPLGGTGGEQFAGNAAPNSYAYGVHEGGGDYYCDPVAGYGNAFYSRDAGYEAQWNQADPLQEASDPLQEASLSGSYYPTVPSSFQPQLYGTPISALAYDDEYEAIYVASQTQPLGKYAAGKRASMMSCHSSTDGMLYSSCAAHPEASQTTLNTVYDTFYRGNKPAQSTRIGIPLVPPHAFQPFGADSLTIGSVYSKYQLGVTSLMPMKGYVASVSPSAVRVHTQGGLCVSDNDIEGMVTGCLHPGHVHVSVGGVAIENNQSHVYFMDIYQNLRTVSSTTFRSNEASFGVMCMATNHEKQTLVAGCSDGTLRLLDASFRSRGRGSELAKVKSHVAGVTNVATSNDGNLVCTTGLASRGPSGSTIPYGFPDQHVLIYDVRYLGRGGILHPFSAVNSGPRLVSFIPDTVDQPNNRVLVASGQSKGGIQIITPFDITSGTHFLVPQLAHGESMTAVGTSGEYLAIGTSQCNVLQYELAGYKRQRQQSHRASSFGVNASEYLGSGASTTGYGASTIALSEPPADKKPLVFPPYVPEPPAMSIDPALLQSSGDPALRNGATDKLKSLFTSYIMCKDPNAFKKGELSAFHAFANSLLLTAPKRNVSNELLKASSKIEGDVMASIMTSDLGVDLFKSEISDKKKVNEDDSLPNPNRILHSNTLSSLCFEKSEVRETRKDNDRETRSKKADRDDMLVDSHDGIPMRYRKLQKPSHSKGSVFSNAKYNATGVWPGWDYPPSMPNAYAPPVLLYLYFIPEIRSILMSRQFDKHGKATATAVPPLSAELGCVFHQIDCLSNFARIYPDESMMAKVGAFVPSNLLASFASMPEADGLALLDGSPAAVERARRPEAFVRFLLHHLHKELSSKNGGSDIIGNLHGFTFVCVNDFVTGSGAPVVSEHFSMTLDLSYVKKSEQVKFCQVLHNSLSKESPLRAWCKESKSYETIVQRKVAVSLPSVLAISCCCAGTGNEEGLSIWRENAPENGHWLPEFIEIEIEDSGNVVVREAVDGDGPGDRVWVEFKGDSKLPSAVAEVVKTKLARKRKYCYRLDAVLSFVREDTGDHSADEVQGHHVLHVRVPSSYKRQAYEKQLAKAQTVASTNEASSDSGEVSKRLTIASAIKPNVLQKRIEDLKERIRAADESQSGDDDWVLFNGFVVSPTVAEDARAFHVSFRDPCLVIFRAIDDGGGSAKKERKNSDNGKEPSKLGLSVMQTKSIYSGRKPEFNPQRSSMLPGQGDLIAFDAEFVCVQEEESELTDRGSKVTVRETRLTLARISVIDCQSGTVIVDDYVVPCEPVVDYLTRFSGITAADLDPKKSPHHLVTMQSAYLKLRYLCERGCIFVGHGLSQDFLTVNLVVPPDQIIDTVEIFHQDRMRYVSLRFLTNYVFGRDMQQDVHDSVEDARAAYALYLKALELKKEGKFDKFLQDLYVYGAARDWKLGIDD